MYGRVMFAILVFAVVLNLVLRYLDDRRRAIESARNARAQLKLSREYAVIIGHVLSTSRALHVWADHWGEPPEIVRPLLQEAFRVPRPVLDEDDE